MLGYATDKAGDVLGDAAQVLWGSAKQNPMIAITLLITALFAPWFSSRSAIL